MFTKNFSKLLGEIDGQFTKGTIYMLDDNSGIEVERTSTGRLSLDLPMGGGTPNGRIIEFYGAESSGKTTAAIHAIAEHQKQGKGCAFIDYEHAFDPEYARGLGVDTKNLVFTQPTHAEQGLSLIEKLIDTGELDLIVVDSVAAMLPKAELEGDMGDLKMGAHARLMSQAMRKLAGKTYKNNTTIIFINQTREKIGVMFGSPITTAGGNALKFYASVRVEFYGGSAIKEKTGDKDTVAKRGHLKVVKNKTYPPYKKSQYDLEFGRGISRESEILDYGTEFGVITQKGAWYYYFPSENEEDKVTLGQGRDNAKITLMDNPELSEELMVLIQQQI